MNREVISAIAELIGAIGVIVSLLYLAAQIRQNTRFTRAATLQAAAAQASEIHRSLSEDSETARIFRVGLSDPAQLDVDESVRFLSMLSQLFRGYESMFVQYKAGTVDELSWRAWRAGMAGVLRSPGAAHFWKVRGLAYRSDFQVAVAEAGPEGFPRPDA